MRRALVWSATILGAALAASSAQAQTSKDAYPQAVTSRPITLPQYMAEIRAEAMFNISRNNVFKDVSLTPDVYFGITDDVQVGINHSKTMGIYTGPSTAPLCIGGNSQCYGGKVYDQVAIDGLFRVLKKDEFQLGVHGILGAQSLDPFGMGVRVGVFGRWKPADIFSLDFDPGLGIGITNRDRSFKAISAGNKEYLYLPMRANVQATEALTIFGDVYTVLPFDRAGDFIRFGTNLGAQYAITNKIDVGAEFRLPFLIHGEAYRNTGFDVRQIGVFANFRL